MNAAAATPADIPEQAIRELQEGLAATAEIESTTECRRELKRVIRNASSLLEAHATAPNRFRTLGLIFQAQRDLLVLRNDERNRGALLETCKQLADAPQEYAVERLPADALLMQLQFDDEGTTEHDRAVAIAELADRYRGTSAEIDSLIVASELAFNLGEAELLGAFRSTLANKFRESPKATGFLKDRFASKSSSLLFRGRFKRVDGEEIVFPIDRAGHVYLSCFWSSQLNDLKQRLMAIKDLQKEYPGQFEVFSFNLDELPDAGKGTLDALGLDWTPMHLPGGSQNLLFSAGGFDRLFLTRITNVNGYMILTPTTHVADRFGRVFDLEAYLQLTLDKARYRSMTQALRIGDFLVMDPSGPSATVFPSGWENWDLPSEALKTIQACFFAPPLRYRLTSDEVLQNYQMAAGLCADMIAKHPESAHLWFVCNRRIIALLGMWNISGEPKHLREAVEVSKTALAMDMPPEEQVVPRFCLEKNALRQEDAEPEALLSGFMKAAGDEKASGLAIAAATVLSLDAGSPSIFEEYRQKLLDEHVDNPRLSPLTAYLFNRFVVGRLFRGNYHGSEVRVYAGFREWQEDTETRPRKFLVELQSLTGEPVQVPHSDKDKSNVVVFMEPPADEASAKVQVDLVKSLDGLAGAHPHGNMNFVAAFVTGDTNEVRTLVAKHGWNADRTALVPGGLRNPHVTRLGIFLADERPNTFVVGSDGTIAWSMSGMYQMAVGVSAISRTVKSMVQAHDLGVGELALKEGHFDKALKIFTEALPDYREKPLSVRTAQRMGLARTCIGLKNWQEALKTFDEIQAEHATAACLAPCACRSLARKLRARSSLLEQLGRKPDAAADRQRETRLACPRSGTIRFLPDRFEQEIFNSLAGLIHRKDWQAAFDYIDDIIVHGKDGRQKERNEFAGFLREHALILEQLGEKAKAQEYRQWADALTTGIEMRTTGGGASRREQRYVDLVEET